MKKSRKQDLVVKNKIFRTGWIVSILLAMYIIGTAGYKTYQNYILRENGICTSGVVYHRYWGYRNVKTQYRFMWKNKMYEGVSSSNADAKFLRTSNVKGEDLFLTSDTIAIVFLESNPNINGSNTVVKKGCISTARSSL
jgi:hypothetical protein